MTKRYRSAFMGSSGFCVATPASASAAARKPASGAVKHPAPAKKKVATDDPTVKSSRAEAA